MEVTVVVVECVVDTVAVTVVVVVTVTDADGRLRTTAGTSAPTSAPLAPVKIPSPSCGNKECKRQQGEEMQSTHTSPK